MPASLATPVVSAPASASPWMWFLAGVMGAAGLGAGGAALYLGQHDRAPVPTPVVASDKTAQPLPSVGVPAPVAPAAPSSRFKQKPPVAQANKAHSAPENVASGAASDRAASTAARPVGAVTQPVWDPAPTRIACSSCGTVQSVTPVAAEGKPSGVGAVAGAVLGGLLGNQFGGGDGKTLATIGGVLGGAYAGNTVEKRMNQQTTYRVLVRMDDGSTRSVELSNPSYGVGARVSVQGNVLTPVRDTAAQGA